MQKNILFVANLSEDVGKEDLAEHFHYFGNVRFINLVEKKRIARLEFPTPPSILLHNVI